VRAAEPKNLKSGNSHTVDIYRHSTQQCIMTKLISSLKPASSELSYASLRVPVEKQQQTTTCSFQSKFNGIEAKGIYRRKISTGTQQRRALYNRGVISYNGLSS
jgi:hypothetical protein